jgi:hypothetical protein
VTVSIDSVEGATGAGQHDEVLRDTADRRGQREPAEGDHEDPLAAQVVTDPAAQQQ